MGWQVNDLIAITGAPLVDASISGYAFDAQGTRHAMYVGTDFHLHELWWQPYVWNHNDLTIAANSPQPINAGNGYIFQFGQYVPYFGLEGGLYQLRWDTSGWHYDDLDELTGGGGTFTGATHGYVFPAQGTRHVLFPDGFGHIRQYWADINGWYQDDLTNAAGAPISRSNPWGYMFPAQNTQHVIYSGQDTHIHELWWNDQGWHHNDLSAVTGAPPAQIGGRPMGYVFPSQGTQHVNYIGADNHVHELWWNDQGWHHNDLTLAAGSPDCIGEPFGCALGCTQHVFFVGTDYNIHELLWDSNGWHHNDLTTTVGAPPTSLVVQIYAYTSEALGALYVLYRTDKKELIELSWSS